MPPRGPFAESSRSPKMEPQRAVDTDGVSAPSLDDSLRIVGRMPGVDAWCALAEEVLVAFGMTDDERAELVATIRGREDPAGLLLSRIAAHAQTELAADGPD